MTFTDYAKSKGLDLLRDDITFLRSRMSSVPIKEQRTVILRRYVQEWCEGMDNESVSFKKQNKGRFKANTWLGAMV
jgi:hypothetical protein